MQKYELFAHIFLPPMRVPYAFKESTSFGGAENRTVGLFALTRRSSSAPDALSCEKYASFAYSILTTDARLRRSP